MRNIRYLTNEKQVTKMKKRWPIFKLSRRQAELLRWIGKVRPRYQTYTIEIIHQLTKPPIVRVLSPELTRLPNNEEGELPHVYGPASDPKLCLYDPKADEWDHSMYISQTIVPWTLDWLTCYELWLMTGKWTCGGRHEIVQ